MRVRRVSTLIALAAVPAMLTIAGCANGRRAKPGAPVCQIDTRPVTLAGHDGTNRPGRHALRRWDVAASSGWDQDGEPQTEGYARYRETINRSPGTEVQTHALNARGDYNSSLISMASRQYLKPASCLERAIYGDFIAEAGRDTSINGFDGYVLEDKATGVVRALYELTPTEDANGADPIDTVMVGDRGAGWTLLYEIHAHPMSRAASGNRSGAVAPTVSDAAYEVQLHNVAGLREARITNGSVTTRIPSDAFRFFQSEP